MERIARESESSTSGMTSEEALGTSSSSSNSSSSSSEPGQEGSHVQVAMLKDAADFSQQEQLPQQQDLQCLDMEEAENHMMVLATQQPSEFIKVPVPGFPSQSKMAETPPSLCKKSWWKFY